MKSMFRRPGPISPWSTTQRALNSLPFSLLSSSYCTLITSVLHVTFDVHLSCPQLTRWATWSRCFAGTDSPWLIFDTKSSPFASLATAPTSLFIRCHHLLNLNHHLHRVFYVCLIHSQHDELRQVAVSLGPIRHDLQHKSSPLPFLFIAF